MDAQIERIPIYVITHGSYSDYGIVAVFTDLDLAERYIELYSGKYENMRIEYYESNPNQEEMKVGLVYFTFSMDRDGNVGGISRRAPYDIDKYYFKVYRPYFLNRDVDDGLELICGVIATSDEHAVKIANEVRVQIIASNNWKADYKWGD